MLYSPAMAEASQLTPMFRQYRSLKQEQPGVDPALPHGRLLRDVLRGRAGRQPPARADADRARQGHRQRRADVRFPAPPAGVLHRPAGAGHRKVAICDQVEDPKKAKGLVRRESCASSHPGPVNDPSQLDSKSNACGSPRSRFLRRQRLGAAFLDASTGEFLAWESADRDAAWERARRAPASFAPREIVFPEDLAWAGGIARSAALARAPSSRRRDPYAFSPRRRAMRPLLESSSAWPRSTASDCATGPAAIAAAAGLLHYVQDTQRCSMEHIDRLLLARAVASPAARPGHPAQPGARALAARRWPRRARCFTPWTTTSPPAGGRLLRALAAGPAARRRSGDRSRQDAVARTVRRARRAARCGTRAAAKACTTSSACWARTVAGNRQRPRPAGA